MRLHEATSTLSELTVKILDAGRWAENEVVHQNRNLVWNFEDYLKVKSQRQKICSNTDHAVTYCQNWQLFWIFFIFHF